VKLLTEARRRFPGAPEIVYYLAIAQREAKQSQQAVATFEEALHEAQLDEDDDVINAKFYFNYGAAAEQAGLTKKRLICSDSQFRSTRQIRRKPTTTLDTCGRITI